MESECFTVRTNVYTVVRKILFVCLFVLKKKKKYVVLVTGAGGEIGFEKGLVENISG